MVLHACYILLWPAYVPCLLCSCDTYFPSLVLSDILSYILPHSWHHNAHLMDNDNGAKKRRKKKPTMTCFAKSLLSKTRTNGLISSTNARLYPRLVRCYISVRGKWLCLRLSYIFFAPFISIMLLHIHPGRVCVHTLLLCPYNPVSMTTGFSSIRPGRGMICELRVNHMLFHPEPWLAPCLPFTNAHKEPYRVGGRDFALWLFSRAFWFTASYSLSMISICYTSQHNKTEIGGPATILQLLLWVNVCPLSILLLCFFPE